MVAPSQRLLSALAPYAGGEPLELLEVGFSFEVLATRSLVFRVPRTSAAAARLDSERALLASVRDVPFAVPIESFRVEVSADVPLGASAAPRLAGGPPSEEQLRPALAAQVGRALAALHRLAPEAAGVATREARWGELQETREATGRVLRELLPAGECRRALALWDGLLAEALAGGRRPVLVHGDAWHGNLLVAGTELVGIVDWERGGLGDAAEDLALALHAGTPFARAVWRAYGSLDHELRRSIQTWWGMREFSGFLPAAQAQDDEELAACVDKLRRSQLLGA
jgi:aminoglycoside phosphotransferase (APT) family kinase protein